MYAIRSPKVFFVAACLLLGACSSGRPPSGPYAAWLNQDESVKSVKQNGPFTILHVEWRNYRWGSFSPLPQDYDRVLHGDKVVIERAEPAEPWQGAGQAAILAYRYAGDQSPLQLVYERKGKAVVERLDVGSAATTVGEDIGPGLRYFSSGGKYNAGFLLKGFPVEIKPLPLGLSNPSITYLAGIAPDLSAFAYADSPNAPTVVALVDLQGQTGDPLPIPATTGVSDKVRVDGPPGQIHPWFDARFKWQQNAAGRWDIAKAAGESTSHRTTNAVEEIFLDASTGYDNCFASSSPACLPGWRRQMDGGAAAYATCSCEAPYVYQPEQATLAFGAHVRSMHYARAKSGSAYHLVLDAPPEKVASEFRKRLAGRGIKHLAPEGISTESVETFLGEESWRDAWIRLVADKPQSLQFVMPTVAVRIEAFGQGTIISTIARYPDKQHRPDASGRRNPSEPAALNYQP
ncbi:hypothetical protein [Pseudoduganella violaceinigra]|uniref:hypothetical protein n=1 Tax=Pseudoduganella violaceinigra TaxID=246602 RepID=UPI0012B524F0|nr:hypothetical protein [Pseudoduganella violaceinigra]